VLHENIRRFDNLNAERKKVHEEKREKIRLQPIYARTLLNKAQLGVGHSTARQKADGLVKAKKCTKDGNSKNYPMVELCPQQSFVW
jgi:hypothetical protein